MDTIVSFNIGRGGRFYNGGHKSFTGCNNLSEILQLNDSSKNHSFLNYENCENIRQILIKRNLTNIEKYLDFCIENDYPDLFFDKTGLDLGELYYYDQSGNLLISVEDVKKGVGEIDWDGVYDTDICVYLKDCDENELKVILDSCVWNSIDLIKEYFDKHTDITIDWDRFNGNYDGLISMYFDYEFDLEYFYNTETV